MTVQQWRQYELYKNSRDSVRAYYDFVHHCHASALCELLTERCKSGLDIACGFGESTRIVSRFCDQVIGIDSSQEMIRLAKEQNLGAKFQFICSRFEDYVRDGVGFDLVSSTWFLNHIHDRPTLQQVLERIAAMLRPDGYVSFVVPSASFTAPLLQRIAREKLDWIQAWQDQQADFTKGVFRYGEEWIPTTIWQPIFLMRQMNRWFEVHTWDVKAAMVAEQRLPFLVTDPPFEVIYGKKRGREV